MAEVDTRNLEWKDNNVGSKLLQKMGWKDGQSIGKRRLLKSESDVSSEGLRVKRRAEGLGLGATTTMTQQGISHAADFASLLQTLHEEHATGENNNKKRKKKKTKGAAVALVMPTNKSTHAKVRQAKFQEKTADDMKCIFAGADVFAAIASAQKKTVSEKKRKRRSDDSDKAEKKSKKKDKSKKEKK